MKTIAQISWFLLCISPSNGKLIGKGLPEQNSLVALSERQPEVKVEVPKDLPDDVKDVKVDVPDQHELGVPTPPPSKGGKCKKSDECLSGCWCAHGMCKYYGGEKDHRLCAERTNGFDLGDGEFCWDGRRERYCKAKAPLVVTTKKPSSAKKKDKDEGVVDEAIGEANKASKETMRKAGKMNPRQMFMDDINMMFDYLMPGKRPNIIKKIVEVILVVIVVIWFIIYRAYVYVDDRDPKMEHWGHLTIAPREDDPRIQLMKPDIVLVFHKPDFDYSDKDKDVPVSVLETAIVAKNGDFPRAEGILESAISNKGGMWTKLRKSMSGKLKKLKVATPEQLKAAEEAEEANESATQDSEISNTKMGAFRTALLQDICEHMPKKGFDVAVFSSVDNDELFVCIGLRNEKTIKQHLQRYGMKLQLQHEVVLTLDIDQPLDEVESSPPYIRYDRRLAENVWGVGKKDTDVFRNWGAHSGKPVVISGTDRIRIIHQHLNAHLNLDYAVSQKLMVQWYPAHNEVRVAELQRTWARWSLLTDLTVRQPLSLIREYFGSRVAFIFAWMGLYAKMLLCLLPVALVWELLNFIASMIGKTEHWNRGSVMGFSFAIIIWAKMAFNLWKQEEDFLKILWDLNHVDKDRSERPDFTGTLEPDPADGNKMALAYPPWKYKARQALSWTITLLFCTFVFCCVVMWLDLFKGRMNLVASIVQAIMIQVFTQIYNWMAEALTLAENHKYQDSFYTSYLKKMFIFQLVNQYSAFFYMAVKQQFTPGGCPNDDCIGLIQGALPVTLLILAIMQIVQTGIATLLVHFSLWMEQHQMRVSGFEPPVYSYVEEQGKYGNFRIREQIEVMSQLSLTLGYILIFGCVAPRIVPLCLLVFLIQLRAGGVLMTTAVNRTVPRTTVGIGPWNDVFYFLMLIGILFSAYLLVQFAPLFHDTMLLTKLTGFLLYCFLIAFVWVGVDLVCPTTDPSSELLDDRRKAVEHVVHQIHEDKNFEASGFVHSPEPTPRRDQRERLKTTSHLGEADYVDEVVEGNWEGVPQLIPAQKVEDTA